jgi:hypothetical protein
MTINHIRSVARYSELYLSYLPYLMLFIQFEFLTKLRAVQSAPEHCVEEQGVLRKFLTVLLEILGIQFFEVATIPR